MILNKIKLGTESGNWLTEPTHHRLPSFALLCPAHTHDAMPWHVRAASRRKGLPMVCAEKHIEDGPVRAVVLDDEIVVVEVVADWEKVPVYKDGIQHVHKPKDLRHTKVNGKEERGEGC
jgi:hypothetical protein